MAYLDVENVQYMFFNKICETKIYVLRSFYILAQSIMHIFFMLMHIVKGKKNSIPLVIVKTCLQFMKMKIKYIFHSLFKKQSIDFL